MEDNKQIKSAEDKLQQAIELVKNYWKFDEYQKPMSSWHDKQDLLERLLSLQSGVKPDESSDAVDFVEWMVKDMKVDRVAGMWEVHGLAHEFEDGKTAICPVRSTAWLYEYYTRKNNQQ